MSIPIYVPLCIDCIHYDLGKEANGCAVCKAYPEGIPYEVWKEKSKPSADKGRTVSERVQIQAYKVK